VNPDPDYVTLCDIAAAAGLHVLLSAGPLVEHAPQRSRSELDQLTVLRPRTRHAPADMVLATVPVFDDVGVAAREMRRILGR